MWWILIKALKSLSNLLFDWCLLCKVYNVWPKKYKGVLIHDAEVSCKIWRTDSKMTGIWWIFTKALRNLKIFTFMGYFCPKYIMFELKKYRGVMFYDNEEWWKIWRLNWLVVWKMMWGICAKFQEKLTCQFKIDMKNLTNFVPSTRKSQKFAL